jgi:hypothetical protein
MTDKRLPDAERLHRMLKQDEEALSIARRIIDGSLEWQEGLSRLLTRLAVMFPSSEIAVGSVDHLLRSLVFPVEQPANNGRPTMEQVPKYVPSPLLKDRDPERYREIGQLIAADSEFQTAIKQLSPIHGQEYVNLFRNRYTHLNDSLSREDIVHLLLDFTKYSKS